MNAQSIKSCVISIHVIFKPCNVTCTNTCINVQCTSLVCAQFPLQAEAYALLIEASLLHSPITNVYVPVYKIQFYHMHTHK